MSPGLFIPLSPVLIAIFALAGVVVTALGIRGRPVFASPRCRKCGYDLRNVQFMNADAAMKCPECGQSLADPAAVSFGTWQRQPRRIVWGFALIALPWVAGLALFALRSRMQPATAAATGSTFLTPQQRAALPTSAFLARLKTTANEPWDWQELQARMSRNQLTQSEIDQALAILTANIAARRAKSGRREPLHWADQFVKPAVANGSASPQEVVALAKVFYGVDPKFTMRSTAREGEPIALTLNEYESWDLPGMQLVWSLSSIVVDGNVTLTPQLRYPIGRRGQTQVPTPPDQFSGTGRDGEMQLMLPHALTPGEHEVVITREVGVVAQGVTMRGLDGKPGTPEKWPAPCARWTSVVKKKLSVAPKGKSVLNVITDPAQDPFRNGDSITIEQALTRASSRGVELVLKFKVNGTLMPLVSYHVYVRAGGEKLDYGTLVAGAETGRGQFQSSTSAKAFKSIPPDLKTIDVLFELDETAAERFTGIETVWGGPYQIRGVKLERYDLGSNAQTQPAGAERL